MKTKKNLLALSLIFAFTFLGANLFAKNWGQGQGRGCSRFNERRGGSLGFINRIPEDLNLTEEQVEKIFKITSEYRLKIFENRKNYETIAKLKEEEKEAIKNVLTDEQKEKFETLGQSRGKFRGRKRFKTSNDCPYQENNDCPYAD